MSVKKRHGCLTAWIIYMLIGNSILSIVYFFNTDTLSETSPDYISENMFLLYGSIWILNVAFLILLLNWVKWSFWGLTITSITIFFINLIAGKEITQPILGLIGIVVLVLLLQIKVEKISGWNNLV